MHKEPYTKMLLAIVALLFPSHATGVGDEIGEGGMLGPSLVYEYETTIKVDTDGEIPAKEDLIVSTAWQRNDANGRRQSSLLHIQVQNSHTSSLEEIKKAFLVLFTDQWATSKIYLHSSDSPAVRNFKRGLMRSLAPFTLPHQGMDTNCTGVFNDISSNSASASVQWSNSYHCIYSSQLAKGPAFLDSIQHFSSLQQNVEVDGNGITIASQLTERRKMVLLASQTLLVQATTWQTLKLQKTAENTFASVQKASVEATAAMFPDYDAFDVEFELSRDVEAPASVAADKAETQTGRTLTAANGETFVSQNVRLLLRPDHRAESYDIKELSSRIKRLKKHLAKSSAASVNSARAFLLLQESAGDAQTEEIVALLKGALFAKKKQPSIVLFILDTLAHSQSWAGLQAVEQVLDYRKQPDHLQLFQRYIMAHSLALRPATDIVDRLLKLSASEEVQGSLKEAIVLSLGAMGNRLADLSDNASLANNNVNQQTVSSIQSAMSQSLSQCTSNKPSRSQKEITECQELYLRGLGNLAASSQLAVVLSFISHGGLVGSTAIRSLRRYRWPQISPSLGKTAAETVWKAYESTATLYASASKIAAAEWLISNLEMATDDVLEGVTRLILALPAIRSLEVRTYVLSLLRNNPRLAPFLRGALPLAASRSSHMKLPALAMGGQSVAYQGVLSQTTHINASYNLAMEFSGGTMRTSTVGVTLSHGQTSLPIISFGLYSHGLASFMGGGGGGGGGGSGDEDSVTAGLMLEMLDISLPRVVFFNGLGELTSMALSSSGSDPVAEMQFNLMLLDGGAEVIVSNGISIKCNIKRSVAAELSGYVDVSLWYQTSKSIVRNRAVVVTQVTKSAQLVEDMVFQGLTTETAQGRMDFITHVTFFSFPVNICMQMSNTAIRNRLYSKSRWRWPSDASAQPISASKPLLFSSRLTLPPRSFSLGGNNAKNCRVLNAE